MRLHSINISIIVPVYNAMPYLAGCIDSIRKQTYENIEIIIIDDGSNDGSGDYCDEMATRDSRIIVYHDINKGLVSARQSGVEKTTGEYFVFVDSDDEVDEHFIEKLVVEIEERESDILLFGLVEEGEFSVTYRNNYFAEGYYDTKRINNEILDSMITGDVFFSFHILPNLVCKCIKKSWYDKCIKEVYPFVRYGEDAALTYQIIPQAGSISIIDFYPYHYIKRDESMVSGRTDILEISALENSIKDTFLKLGIYNRFENQLNRYISFVYLVKTPDKVLDVLELSNYSVALYGAGASGQAVNRLIENNVVLWVDKNYSSYKKKGFKVNSVDCLVEEYNKYDVIYIANTNEIACKEIVANLRQMCIMSPILYAKYDDGKIKVISDTV